MTGWNLEGTETILSGGELAVDSGSTLTLNGSFAGKLAGGSASISSYTATSLTFTGDLVVKYIRVNNVVICTFTTSTSVTVLRDTAGDIQFAASEIIDRTSNFTNYSVQGYGNIAIPVGSFVTLRVNCWVTNADTTSKNIRINVVNSDPADAVGPLHGVFQYTIA